MTKSGYTQKDYVRQHLLEGHSITPLQALAEYGIFRLASVINRLRNEGLNIRTNVKRSRMNKPYAEYFLER